MNGRARNGRGVLQIAMTGGGKATAGAGIKKGEREKMGVRTDFIQQRCSLI